MKKLIYTLGISLLFIACTEDILEDPQLEVITEKTEFSVGEEIQFNFTGNPNYISFYSGEPGFEYVYRDRSSSVNGKPVLRFTSKLENGIQAESLNLLISSDFVGPGEISEETIAHVTSANWSDITDRVTLSEGANTSSGDIDLTDYTGNPVYLAFRYRGNEGSIQNKWTISNLTVKNELEDGRVYTLANITKNAINNYGESSIYSPGWVASAIQNEYKWNIGSTLVITGAISSDATPAESWVFSGPIILDKVIPDRSSQHVKGPTIKLNSWIYKYDAPGTYNATFVAFSENIYGRKELVKQLILTITE